MKAMSHLHLMKARSAIACMHAQVLVWSGTGLCEAGTHAPWMLDFLQCCLQSANNEVTIVEDVLKDARCPLMSLSCAAFTQLIVIASSLVLQCIATGLSSRQNRRVSSRAGQSCDKIESWIQGEGLGGGKRRRWYCIICGSAACGCIWHPHWGTVSPHSLIVCMG